MSTKDLIERLNRSRGTRSQRSATTTPAGDPQETEKRIATGVIRRRRVEQDATPDPAEARQAARQAAPERPRTVIRRPAAVEAEPEAAPVEVTPAEVTPVEVTPVEVAPAEVARTEEPAQAAPEPVEPATLVEAPAATEPEPVAIEAQQAAPVGDATPEVAVVPIEPPVSAAPSAAEPAQAAPAAEPTDARPEDRPAQVSPATDETESKRSGDAPRADTASRRPSPPRLARRAESPAAGLPGLGKAVVRPPPGYDPTDPMAYRRRAKADADASVAQTPGPGRNWRDERRSPPAPGAPGAPPAPAPPRDEEADRRARRRGAGGAPGSTAPPRGRRQRVEMYMDEIPQNWKRNRRSKSKVAKTPSPQAKAIKRRVDVEGLITVSTLAHAMSVKSSQVIKALMSLGQMATANDVLDFETAQLVANEFDHEVINTAFQEDVHFIDHVEDPESLEPRPPVVTIMGHVDHGKTTLLDSVRKTKVAAGEAGGITQHIGAYQVERNGHKVTFIDTPGHEAFTSMRARGAQVTDIVVLVVAADDGVMPQTIEAINHAKAAGVPIVVAVNKIDKANANPARVRQALMEYELVPEEYGGETMFVNVSALKGEGIDDLLDSILLIAEVAEYTANPDRHAEGTVLEARLERGRGTVATVLVSKGTLSQGDYVVIGHTWGRVRAMTDFKGKRIKTAGPSTPVEIIGLQDVPASGDDLVVVESDRDAKALAEHRSEIARQASMAAPARLSLEDLLAHANANEKVELNLIVKADVGGTLEAIRHSFAKISVAGATLKILHAGVGAISESDITLAHTYRGIVIGFNVRPDAKARQAADEFGVDVRTYSVIYEAIDEVTKAMQGLLAPTLEERVQGTAEIRQAFHVPKIGTVAGCMVTEGKIARSHQIRLLRDGKIMWTGRLASLRRFKDDVREVEKGYECGMNLDGYNDIKVGDLIESFTREEVAASS